MSSPFSYLYFSFSSNDGGSHSVQLYSDVTGGMLLRLPFIPIISGTFRNSWTLLVNRMDIRGFDPANVMVRDQRWISHHSSGKSRLSTAISNRKKYMPRWYLVLCYGKRTSKFLVTYSTYGAQPAGTLVTIYVLADWTL